MSDKSCKAVPREPDQAMVDAGWAAYYKHATPGMMPPLWRAMYDAAPVLATAPAEPPKDGKVAALIERLRKARESLVEHSVTIEQWDGSLYLEAADALARLSAPVPRSQWDESAGLTWRHPAPDAAVPMVPSPHQSLTIGVAAPVPAQEWVPVGERLPQRNDWVMTWDGLNIWPAVADPVSQSFDRSVPKFDDDNARPVTHWMPLPPPPAVDK